MSMNDFLSMSCQESGENKVSIFTPNINKLKIYELESERDSVCKGSSMI